MTKKQIKTRARIVRSKIEVILGSEKMWIYNGNDKNVFDLLTRIYGGINQALDGLDDIIDS